MDIDHFILPDDFGIDRNLNAIYFYSNSESSVKNKVVFTRNMLCLLLHGIKEVHSAFGKEVITNKDVLMLMSGSVLMSESIAENAKYEAILLFFDNQTLIEICSQLGLKGGKDPETQIVHKVQRDQFLSNFCQSLQLLKESKNLKIADFKIREVLAYISVTYPDTFKSYVSKALSSSGDIRLKQIVDLNIQKGLTIEELAFLCNMSLSTFKRHFSEIYKTSPQKYFTQFKMEQAKTFLALKRRPSEIYSELGYANLSAFSNEFKKYFGFAPSHSHTSFELVEKETDLLK